MIGAGGVGLLYGAHLAVAGHTVRWVVRSGAETVRADGIRVVTGGGELRIPAAEVETHDHPGDAPASDVVIVALKTTANAGLADGATVAVFQNGLGVEEMLRTAVPHAGPVLGCMCFVCVHRLGPGVADHLDYGAVTIGALDPADGSAAQALGEDLTAAGVEATTVDHLVTARWRKLVWNIPFNGLSVVLDATTDELLGETPTRSLVAGLMDEVIAAGNAAGAEIPAAFRDEMLATTDAMTPYAPSMKLDADAGRPLEIDAIYDAPVRAASGAGVHMPRTSMLAAQLRFRDRRRHGGPAAVARPTTSSVSRP